MAVDTNLIISTNAFAGFQSYNFVSFSATYGGGNIGAGSFVGPIRASIALNNTDAVSIVTIQYVGLDSFTRLLPGELTIDYPNFASASYQIENFSYYTGGNLVVDTYIINEGGTTVALPAITFACRAGLYQAPF